MNKGSDNAQKHRRDGWDNPMLLSARDAAALCGRSVRTWRSWHAAGLVPAPVNIGRSTFWRAAELRLWIRAGCPRREEWEKTRPDSANAT